MPQARLHFRAARGGALLPTHTVPGALRRGGSEPKACTRQSFILLKWGVGDSGEHFGAVVHAAEEHAVLFLSLNIRFMTLMMSSKEVEPQSADSQELYEAKPRAGAGRDRGEQRWLPKGWSENQNHALSPKLQGSAGAQAMLDGLRRLQKPQLRGCNSHALLVFM